MWRSGTRFTPSFRLREVDRAKPFHNSSTATVADIVGLLNEAQAAHMSKLMPTQVGDVLILATEESFTTYAVGRISENGQQDFQHHENVHYANDRAAALTEAKALVVPGRKILLSSLDTGKWTEIPV